MSRKNKSTKGINKMRPQDIVCPNGSCGGKNTFRKLKASSPESAFWILNIFVETMHELNRAGSTNVATIYEKAKNIILNMDPELLPADICKAHSIPTYEWAKSKNLDSLGTIFKNLYSWKEQEFTHNFIISLPKKQAEDYELKMDYRATIKNSYNILTTVRKYMLQNGRVMTIREAFHIALISSAFPVETPAQIRQTITAGINYAKQELAHELAGGSEPFDTKKLDEHFILFSEIDSADLNDTNHMSIQHEIANTLGRASSREPYTIDYYTKFLPAHILEYKRGEQYDDLFISSEEWSLGKIAADTEIDNQAFLSSFDIKEYGDLLSWAMTYIMSQTFKVQKTDVATQSGVMQHTALVSWDKPETAELIKKVYLYLRDSKPTNKRNAGLKDLLGIPRVKVDIPAGAEPLESDSFVQNKENQNEEKK